MERREAFVTAAREPAPSLPAEFFGFLMCTKKWWLLPILLVMALLAVLMILSSTPAAPFIYTLF